VLDPASPPYADRRRTDPGMIHAGDVVTNAFAAIGWGWGGDFRSIKDSQHFSANGR
jgi:D-alanyl-D-alanine carboxypeptidase